MSFLRFIIFLLGSLALAWLFHLVFFIKGYNSGYSFDSMSNALFVIGVMGFLPALMMHFGTYRMFYGMQYAMKSMFKQGFREKYRLFGDYLIDKKVDAKTTIYLELMLASFLLIALSLTFSIMWGRAF